MRAPSKFSLLALALLASGPAAPAQAAARDASGSAVPQVVLRTPTAADAKDPNIYKPEEPGVDCYVDLSLQEAGTIRDKANISPMGKSCLPQQDAFKRAAEAASYLAIYQHSASDFGTQMQDPKRAKEIGEALTECLSNGPKCNDGSINAQRMKSDLFKALVQYNFGKELKSAQSVGCRPDSGHQYQRAAAHGAVRRCQDRGRRTASHADRRERDDQRRPAAHIHV